VLNCTASIAADSIVDAISFIRPFRHIVLWSENKLSSNLAPDLAGFQFLNLARSLDPVVFEIVISGTTLNIANKSIHSMIRALVQITNVIQPATAGVCKGTTCHYRFPEHRCLVQCESKKIPPEDLWQFFQNGWEFFNQILRAY